MEATLLPTVLDMLVDIPHCCHIVQNLVMDVLVYWVFKGLPSLYLTLAPQTCVLCRQVLSSSVCQAMAGVTQVSMTKVINNARENGPVGVLQMVYQLMPFCPLFS